MTTSTKELIELLSMEEMAVLRNLAYCPLSKEQILKVRHEAAQRLRELQAEVDSYEMSKHMDCPNCGGAVKEAT
jgi:hypothetical protein